MSLSQRSHSAAPGEYSSSAHSYYRSSSPRRGSLSPPDDRYRDYTGLPVPQPGQQGHASSNLGYGVVSAQGSSVGATGGGVGVTGAQTGRFQSRSATATPTGSPKKRQLPQVSVKCGFEM